MPPYQKIIPSQNHFGGSPKNVPGPECRPENPRIRSWLLPHFQHFPDRFFPGSWGAYNEVRLKKSVPLVKMFVGRSPDMSVWRPKTIFNPTKWANTGLGLSNTYCITILWASNIYCITTLWLSSNYCITAWGLSKNHIWAFKNRAGPGPGRARICPLFVPVTVCSADISSMFPLVAIWCYFQSLAYFPWWLSILSLFPFQELPIPLRGVGGMAEGLTNTAEVLQVSKTLPIPLVTAYFPLRSSLFP